YKIVLYSSHNLYEAREIGSEVIAISQGKGIALLPASKIWVGLGAFAAYVALVYVFIPVGGAGSPAAFVSSPPLMDILLVAAVVAVVGYLAWRIPAEAMGPRSARPAAGLGAAGMLGLAFSGDSSLPHIVPWPEVVLIGMFLLSLATFYLLKIWFGREGNVSPLAALTLGAVIPISSSPHFSKRRGDFGALPVALVLVVLTIHVARKAPRDTGAAPV
ncbi:MAG: hypothetical protein ACREBQ_10005, partial [Nitrososphaerales archaeon]